MSTGRMVAVQTAILAVGVAIVVALTVAGVSDWLIVAVALIVGAIAGAYGYVFAKQREAPPAVERR